jgi:hypothetical protein
MIQALVPMFARILRVVIHGAAQSKKRLESSIKEQLFAVIRKAPIVDSYSVCLP